MISTGEVLYFLPFRMISYKNLTIFFTLFADVPVLFNGKLENMKTLARS